MIDTGGQLPFEGSAEIAGIVAGLIREYKVTTFVETGTQRGATALWAAQQDVRVITIESDAVNHIEACANIKGSNILLFFGDSVQELSLLRLPKNESVLFFLDAHSIQGTPIFGEIIAIDRLVTNYSIRPIICIHDIEVPGHPELGFDHYEDGTVLNLERITPALNELFGSDDYAIVFNTIADGAARGFCYITPTP